MKRDVGGLKPSRLPQISGRVIRFTELKCNHPTQMEHGGEIGFHGEDLETNTICTLEQSLALEMFCIGVHFADSWPHHAGLEIRQTPEGIRPNRRDGVLIRAKTSITGGFENIPLFMAN